MLTPISLCLIPLFFRSVLAFAARQGLIINDFV